LRGRVGRSKTARLCAVHPAGEPQAHRQAERRLKVLQSLDTLGAGFQLASHDLDIRGAGNLLGEEQSGHIKEVGFELYQQMLEEAVIGVEGFGRSTDSGWSPQITVGTAVMIPELCADLQLRLALYRRLGDLTSTEEIDAFGAELIDRFGPLPDEVEHLLKIVFIKALCRRPMSKSWMPGRRAWSSTSASANSPTPRGWSNISAIRVRWQRSGRTKASSSCATGRRRRSAWRVLRWR
jgi:transcription-repair coupling factor (superfamily II helicase)